jgi:hypothetical protein
LLSVWGQDTSAGNLKPYRFPAIKLLLPDRVRWSPWSTLVVSSLVASVALRHRARWMIGEMAGSETAELKTRAVRGGDLADSVFNKTLAPQPDLTSPAEPLTTYKPLRRHPF